MTAPLKHPLKPVRRGISVAARDRPFDGRLRTKNIRPGDYVPTIAEILADMPGLPRGFTAICEARINGELVPRSYWHLARPRFNGAIDVAVTFTVPLRGGGGGGGSSGGGGGGQSKIATAATIGVLLVAAAVSGGALGFGAVGIFSAGAVNAVAGAAIGLGGALAIAALVPPPSLNPNQQSSSPSQQSYKPASLSGNVVSPGGPVPRVVGTMRVFPPFLCQPLVDVIDNYQSGLIGGTFGKGTPTSTGGSDESVEVVLGLSGPHALSTLWVDGVDAANIAELQYEVNDGRSGGRPTLVTRYGSTSTPNADIAGHQLNAGVGVTTLQNQTTPDNSSPQWFSFISANSPDEIWLNLAFPSGLTDTSYTQDNQAVRVRFRLRGTSSWTNCPEIHFSSKSTTPFQKSIRLIWATIPASHNTPATIEGPIYAIKSVPGQSAFTPTTTGWTADSYFSSGAGNDVLSFSTVGSTKVINTELYSTKAVFYLDVGTFAKGVYEIQVMRSCPYVNSLFTPATYIYAQSAPIGGSQVYDFFKYYLLSGSYVIPTSGATSSMAMTRVASVFNSNPIQSSDFAWIAIKLHSRAAQNISILASGYVLDWDGSNWANQTTTSNPAPHFYDVLTGTLGGSPIPASLVNSAEIVTWRTACNSNSYTVNAVIEGKTYADALNLIASAGYARLRHNERWGVFLDKNRSADTPVQVFSARNMRNFAWTRAFAERPTAIRAQYVDAANDYVDAETIVYDDPSAPDGSRISQIRYDGLTVSADVSTRATFDMKQAKLRFTFYQGEADIESIVCERGDLVGVQHDILMKQAGFAYVSQVTTSTGNRYDGNITGLTLDGTIPNSSALAWASSGAAWSSFSSAWSDGRHGLAMRLLGGAGISIKEITNFDTESASVTFVTPFADPGPTQLDAGCLVTSGPLSSEYKRMIVFGIQPQADLTAALTFVDEAPSLFA